MESAVAVHAKGPTGAVVVLDEVVDSCDQVFDASETTSVNRLLGNESEPTLLLIEPGRIGGSVVDLEAGPLCRPESYLGMLVGGVVIDDQVHVKTFRYGLIDALEELKKFLMTMTCLALQCRRRCRVRQTGWWCRGERSRG